MPLVRRGWLRFSVRSLFVLMLLVAVPLAWKVNQVRAQRSAVAQINSAGFCHYRSRNNHVPPPGPAWFRRIAGDDIFDTVFSAHFPKGSGSQGLASLAMLSSLEKVSMERAHDQDLIQIAMVPSLRHVKVWGEFSDAAFARLATLERLEVLDAASPHIGGDVLRHFQTLPKLRVLSVATFGLTDSDVQWIANHESLETVLLASPSLTDATIKHFEASENLTRLTLRSVRFSREATQRLREALPDCDVTVDRE